MAKFFVMQLVSGQSLLLCPDHISRSQASLDGWLFFFGEISALGKGVSLFFFCLGYKWGWTGRGRWSKPCFLKFVSAVVLAKAFPLALPHLSGNGSQSDFIRRATWAPLFFIYLHSSLFRISYQEKKIFLSNPFFILLLSSPRPLHLGHTYIPILVSQRRSIHYIPFSPSSSSSHSFCSLLTHLRHHAVSIILIIVIIIIKRPTIIERPNIINHDPNKVVLRPLQKGPYEQPTRLPLRLLFPPKGLHRFLWSSSEVLGRGKKWYMKRKKKLKT